MHATVNARRLPCQSPLNQAVSSVARTFAFPPYRSRSRMYCLESSGSYPRGFPSGAGAVRYIQIALTNPTIAVAAAASRSNACDIGGCSHLMDGHLPDHSCQAGRRTARARHLHSRATGLEERAARRAAEKLWVVAVDDAPDERRPARPVERPEALGPVTRRRGAPLVAGRPGPRAGRGNALHGVP